MTTLGNCVKLPGHVEVISDIKPLRVEAELVFNCIT